MTVIFWGGISVVNPSFLTSQMWHRFFRSPPSHLKFLEHLKSKPELVEPAKIKQQILQDEPSILKDFPSLPSPSILNSSSSTFHEIDTTIMPAQNYKFRTVPDNIYQISTWNFQGQISGIPSIHVAKICNSYRPIFGPTLWKKIHADIRNHMIMRWPIRLLLFLISRPVIEKTKILQA